MSVPRVLVELPPDAGAATRVALPEASRRHVLKALRLGDGDNVVAFDGSGRSAMGRLVRTGQHWQIELTEAPTSVSALPALTICCAVPKGQRADWLAEKLGELGVTRLVPLLTDRGVVEPGAGKIERWRRLAESAARQSRAPTVLDVAQPVKLATAIESEGQGVVLTTERPAARWAGEATVLYVGPEGGWSPVELEAFDAAGSGFATLGSTVLRVETAAVVAAGLARALGKAV